MSENLLISKNYIPSKGFSVFHLNVRSLKNKLDEIELILHRFKIDVCTCSESWLNDGVEDTCLSIPNYKLFRQDRRSPKKGGGLIIYFSNEYDVDSSCYPHLSHSNNDIESQIIAIKKTKQ